jgi:hypothetical protein
LANDHLNHVALLIMYIGFFGWLGSAGLFIYRGFRSDGRVRLRKAAFWMGLLFVSIIFFITGLVLLGYKS